MQDDVMGVCRYYLYTVVPYVHLSICKLWLDTIYKNTDLTNFLQCRHRANTLLSSYFLARISSMSISYGVSSYSIDSSVWSICFSFAPVIKSPMTCRKFLLCKDELNNIMLKHCTINNSTHLGPIKRKKQTYPIL